MPSYYPSVPGPVTRPLTAANAATGNVAGVAAQVTVQGGTGTPGGAIPGNVTGVAAHVTVAGGTGTPAGAISAGVVVNQWAATFAQPATFGNMPPALQSTVIALTPSTSVGGGSGVPSAGNWLLCITGWQAGLSPATVGTGDDIHSFWRPGDVTTSTWAVSSPSGHTRTSAWYTPNLARIPGDVYVAPSGGMAGRACLVVEVAGIGPWDTVTGITAAYANSTRSLTLALAAPSSASFQIAAVTGDNSLAAPATVFNPGGWTPLHTVIAANGTDHTSDAVLTAAYRGSDSGAVSVSASAGTAENLSGVILSVQIGAPSPVPATQNPNWPYFKFEAAFGGGFNTPDSELTWTDISNRLWSWDETTGVQYQLGQLQATNLDLELDNFDGYLSSLNSASPYFPNVTAGTPLRVRAAIGTIAGQTVNRWYVIQRNAQEWPEEIDEAYRRFAPATGTDIWAVLSATGPTPYRGEVRDDDPYAWWTCDDQPGAGGVLPTTLLNSAAGNSNLLNITLSPNGALVSQAYATDGTAAPGGVIPPVSGSAVYAVGVQQGWMYGDPQSAPASALAGNEITASPGSAAWQASQQFGNTGSDGWFLSCNDTGFPPLSGGITIEGWFNYNYWGSTSGWWFSNVFHDDAGQPYAPLTLVEIATGSHPVAILQLDLSGHLSLITYNGASPTSHSIYSGSDLRSQSWFMVTMTLTTTTWTVWLDGGDLAQVSGSAAGMTSAWTWLIVNGDLGANGGSSAGTGLVHGGNMSVSHLAIYPEILPYYRIAGHYWAAVTGFGLLPAPQSVSPSSVNNGTTGGTGALTVTYSPDGSVYGNDLTQGYGGHGTGIVATPASLAAVVTAVAGGYTSGPSAWGQVSLYGEIVQPSGYDTYGANVFVSWTGLATKFNVYTSTQVAAGAQAGITQADSIAFIQGYGATASVTGVGLISGGSGASPPAAASAIGDTVQQRIERCLNYGNVTYPGRCIDPAPLLVQAALDVGGQQAGQNVQNIAISDGGYLFIDNVSNLVYWQRPHLAAQYSSPVWNLGPDAGRIPYDRAIRWILDPQRAWNAIEIQPYSPTGASLPIITPANGAGVVTSQMQYGAQPFAANSYLQSVTEMQNQANFLFQFYGQPVRRAENVKIDAATYPQAWSLVLGINVSDVVTLQDWQIGGGGTVYTYRVSSIKRKFSFGGDRQVTEASVTLQLDPEPTSYWS